MGTAGGNLWQSVDRANQDIEAVADLSSENGLQFNLLKTQAVWISNRRAVALPPIRVCGSMIPYAESVRDLGVQLNGRFTWGDHVAQICRRVYGALVPLRRLAAFTPEEIRRKIIVAIGLPRFLYCDSIYFNLDSRSSLRLSVAFNACAGYIYLLEPRASVSEYATRILEMNFGDYAKFVYGVLLGRAPDYLGRTLVCGPSLRARALVCPPHRSRMMGDSFEVTATKVWNALPLNLRQIVHPEVFEAELIKHLA